MTEATFRVTIKLEPDEAEKSVDDGIAGVVIKSQDEQRYTLCVAYPAEKADVAVEVAGAKENDA